MAMRFPKRGFRANRFNTLERLEQVNLGTLAYFIQKGVLDPSKVIDMKTLLDTGVLSKIKHGVKFLGNGSEKLKALGVTINLEGSNATARAIEAIKSTGGELKVVHRTPLLMRYHLKPHKFPEYKAFKTPMPSPKKVKKLEKLAEKGMTVEYPNAPWFTENREAIEQEKANKIKRIAEANNAHLLPQLPADRSKGVSKDRARVERKALFKTTKYV